MKHQKIVEVALMDDTYDLLKALNPDPSQAIAILAEHAADGIRRPGAWERDWVIQCFGIDFLDQIEQCPNIPTHDRRRK